MRALCYNFCSPKVARHFKLFSIKVKEGRNYVQVNGTHEDDDFLAVRAALAESYDLSKNMPQIEIVDVDWAGDRWIYLEHRTKNNCRLNYHDMKCTVTNIQQLWGHTVKMEYVDLDGNPLEDI